jgi:predicted RNA-binding Zn-ribbon protein involved in translation (DUF1610 family)
MRPICEAILASFSGSSTTSACSHSSLNRSRFCSRTERSPIGLRLRRIVLQGRSACFYGVPDGSIRSALSANSPRSASSRARSSSLPGSRSLSRLCSIAARASQIRSDNRGIVRFQSRSLICGLPAVLFLHPVLCALANSATLGHFPYFRAAQRSAFCLMRRRSDMARWTLKCENCGFPFPHTLIDDSSAPNYFLPEKPDFPVGGSELECPNCGHEATYQRTDLVYQA